MFGRRAGLRGELENISADSPAQYGIKITEILKNAHSAVKKAQAKSDLKLEDQLRLRYSAEPLSPNDMIYLKREQSVKAKESHLSWIGPFRVLDTNGHIVKIAYDDDNHDYVHREHCVKEIRRYDHLDNDDDDDYASDLNENVFGPEDADPTTASLQHALPKPSLKPPSKIEPSARPTVTNSSSDDEFHTPNAELVPTRRSTRPRKPPDRYTPPLIQRRTSRR